MANLTVRAVVLGILKSYNEPNDENEKQIGALLPLLQRAEESPIRDQAAHVSRLWMGLRGRCPIHYKRLIFYRLRHLDLELERLNQMTMPKKAQCPKITSSEKRLCRTARSKSRLMRPTDTGPTNSRGAAQGR